MAWEWNGSGMVRVAVGMMMVVVMSERVVGGASDMSTVLSWGTPWGGEQPVFLMPVAN